MGVRVFSESPFVQMLSGFLPLDGVMPPQVDIPVIGLRLKNMGPFPLPKSSHEDSLAQTELV